MVRGDPVPSKSFHPFPLIPPKPLSPSVLLLLVLFVLPSLAPPGPSPPVLAPALEGAVLGEEVEEGGAGLGAHLHAGGSAVRLLAALALALLLALKELQHTQTIKRMIPCNGAQALAHFASTRGEVYHFERLASSTGEKRARESLREEQEQLWF